MNPSFGQFAREKNSHFYTAVANLFIFLPHFFSVSTLLRTLFAPWKNISQKKESLGFSLNEWANRLSFNVISRLIGAGARATLIGGYLTLQVMFVLLLPALYIGFNMLLPIMYMLQSSQESEQQRLQNKRSAFIEAHSLTEQTKEAVGAWFDQLQQTSLYNRPWYDLKRLMNSPPLGRNFSAGYTPTLDKYVTELTLAFDHSKNLIAREKEIMQIEQILAKSNEANVVLVGPEGVGKHTVVEALAKRIFEGSSNPILAYKRILKVDMEKVLAQSTDQQTREKIMKDLFTEAAQAKNIIILIDEIDKYVSSEEGRIDLSSAINEFALHDKIQFIGITNPFNYEKYLFKNDKMNETFEKIDIGEVSKDQAQAILLGEIRQFERRNNVTIPYETVVECISKSDYYITNIPFPEKAIDLLDTACSTVRSQNKSIVTPQVITDLLEQKTHVPMEINDKLKTKLLDLEKSLASRVIAQTEATNKLAGALRKSFVIGKTRKKPLASFLFLGPTGVGKTETAKALASVFFDGPDKMIRFDMSMYQSNNNIPQLIGSSTTNEPGLLTQAIRQQPYGVLLLDEIEKADKNLLNIFLSLLDEGYFTDGFGKRVDCRNLMVIATSNAGADFVYSGATTSLIDHLVEKKLFNPEFLNRFDDVIIYKSLDGENIRILAKRMLDSISKEVLEKQGVTITVTDAFVEQLVTKGYNPKFGARNMARIIRDEVENKIAQSILAGTVKKGGTIAF